MAKQTEIVAMSVTMSASMMRKPRFCRYRMASTSAQVMMQPQIIGMPKRIFSAMAEPMTSARSQAAMAISHSTHRNQTTGMRVGVAAGLREVAPGRHAQLDA